MLTLRFSHHCSVLMLIVRQTLNEAVHVKSEELAVTLLLPVRSSEILSIRVEKTCQAAHKSRPDSIGMERLWAHEGYKTKTSAMRVRLAATA